MKEIAWTGYVTIVRTEIRRFMRIKSQTLVPPVITMVLYLYIFGSIIGRKVGTLLDMPYVEFIGPGIIAMALINNAYSNVSSSFFSAKNHRVYEEMFGTPIPSVSIVL
ncbi:MAG: ABC transporter permease, partial [Gammaproteobacteria bacterium]|nr:ABC transporter permease [Gammaproteobacteria bacterium]